MTYVEWPYTVNTKFFKGTNKPEENTQTTEYVSGRRVTILRKSSSRQTLSTKAAASPIE